jgi:hypothetical protein
MQAKHIIGNFELFFGKGGGWGSTCLELEQAQQHNNYKITVGFGVERFSL